MDTIKFGAILDRLLEPGETFDPRDAILLRDALPERPRFTFSLDLTLNGRRKKVGDVADPIRLSRYACFQSADHIDVWNPANEDERWRIVFSRSGAATEIQQLDPKPQEYSLGFLTISTKLDRWKTWKTPQVNRPPATAATTP